ncbi:MAG: SDR family oxidoreductase [Brachybacterium sp.]|nr:SDR family oxidoreductase [Brachybacterium sp.]MDN6399773.1 SDR family oxidoreductase [Brachybacterium sp.]
MDPIAVITGGAGGMGLATAKLLGRNHRIVIADLDRERLDDAVAELHGLGVDASSTVCDITDPASVDALLDRAEAGGHVRAVIHTAGVSPQMGDAEFIFRVNVAGTVNITRSYLRRAGAGDVLVNVASIAGHMSPGLLQPRRAFRLALSDLAACERKLVASTKVMPEGARPGLAYTTSKAFVLWYCRRMAQAFGAQGARILSVSPGTFDTAMGRLEEKSGSGDLVGYSALKRSGDPDEIASVLAFAASEAPGYLTGTDILVDGGTKAGLGLRGIIALARRR